MKWKDLNGEERYRVVEMARKREVSIKELCETFGVSRQTLNRAVKIAEEAATQALEPKSPGRKIKTLNEQEITELSGQVEGLNKELEHWKTKYEVAEAFLDLARRYDRGETLETPSGVRKKKRRKKKRERNKR